MTDDQRIVLIRHAHPVIRPELPSAVWELSERGRADASALGGWLGRLGIDRVRISHEAKAITTGILIADALGVGCEEVGGLDEQGLGAVPWIEDDDTLLAMIRDHFAAPDSIVLGNET